MRENILLLIFKFQKSKSRGRKAHFCSKNSTARERALFGRFRMAKRLRCEALAKTTCEPEDKKEGGRKKKKEKEER
ncbi:hypothetical protein PUN28_013418 [Cardiocondyla obscurior]|uniref:Uncharacterized protein n=1 Tax=Cardiocondyla obscurior TaxID=286306 RepID=A0AAW2F8A5_9HYME